MGGYIGSKGVGIISGIDASIADLNLTDKAAANGVTEANKVLTADANKDVTAIRNLTATGDVTANSAAINANGSGGTTGIHVNKNDIDGYYFQAEFDGGTNNNRTYNLKPPSSDSSSEPFIWSTGNSHAWEVDGSEVLRIGSSKAIGLSGANYGTAGQVLTSAGSGAAPSWADAGGGGEQEFTATGAITAGHPVGLNSDGTISSLISPFGPSGSQSPSFVTEYNNIDYNSSNNTITGLTSTASGGSGGYKLQVASIDASLNFTFGTAVQVPGSDRGVYTAKTQTARDLSTGKYLCIFEETNPGVNLRAAVATVSGTSVSFGSEQQLGSSSEGNNYELVYSGTANKFISFYISSSNYIYARIYTVSGNSVSVSSAITVVSSSINRFDVRLDPSTSKIILAYSDGSDGLKLKSKVCYLNGSTVSSGSVVTVDSAALKADQEIYLTQDTNVNKIVVSYEHNSPQLNYIAIGTVSAGDNTVSYGTPKKGADGASTTAVPFFISTNNTIGLSINSNLYPIKINGTSFDYGDTITAFGGVLVYVSGRNGFYSGGTAPKIKKPVFPKYVGLAAESISDGAAGKVTIIGGINTQQSGLVAGLPYGMPFLSENSTTLTLTNSTVNKVGNAMSSTSIYVQTGEV